MVDRFHKRVKELSSSNSRLLLAVSGGVDSMVMLRLAIEAGLAVGVAHCNFSLRGEESDGDMELVRSECSRLNLPFHPIVFDTYNEMAKRGESLQIVARELRYGWFDKVCADYGYTHIAIAHNSGDSVETMFINMLRGTGLKGMIGIPTTRGAIIRPLMIFSRNEIESYAVANGVSWRDDSTNSGTKYLRNKLRHNIIPQFKEIEPNFEKIVMGNISRMEAANSFICCMVDEVMRRAVSLYRGRITISLNVLEGYNPFEFLLYEVLSRYGFRSNVVSEVALSYAKGASATFLSDSYKGVLSHSLLILTPLNESLLYPEEQCITDFSYQGVVSFEVVDYDDKFKFKQDSAVAYLDADKVTLPFTLRSWHEGDIFVPFGMSGKKKLSDLFIDMKVHLADKKSIPILVDGSGDILWVVNLRSDNRYRVSSSTKQVLIVSFLGSDDR